VKQQRQSGFAHLIVITVILGLALVGTLGYVYYQNFIQKKDTVSTNQLYSGDLFSFEYPKTGWTVTEGELPSSLQ